jgi:hypothetical protein
MDTVQMASIYKHNILSSEAFIFDYKNEKRKKILTVRFYFLVSCAWGRLNKSSITEKCWHIMGKIFHWKEGTWSLPLKRLRIKMLQAIWCISWCNGTWVPQIYTYFVYLYLHSEVGTATRYGLDCPGSNPGVDKIFRTGSERLWGLPSVLYDGYWGKYL